MTGGFLEQEVDGNTQARGPLSCQGSCFSAGARRKLSHPCSAGPPAGPRRMMEASCEKAETPALPSPQSLLRAGPCGRPRLASGPCGPLLRLGWQKQPAWSCPPALMPLRVRGGESGRQEPETPKWLHLRPRPLVSFLCKMHACPACCSGSPLVAQHWEPSEHYCWWGPHRSTQVWGHGRGLLEAQPSSDWKVMYPPQPRRPENFLENMSLPAPLHWRLTVKPREPTS